MVYGYQNVNFNGGFNYSYMDIENLAKYATGVALTNKDELGVSEVLTGAASNLALQGGTWLFKNRKDLSGAFKALKDTSASGAAASTAASTASTVAQGASAAKGVGALVAKSPVASKCLQTFKAQGGGAMLVMEGGFEVVTNVIPTFSQLGAKSGMKQLGKSTVKTCASVGGWVAGAALGTKLGAAIGSIIPGAGTAVGAVVGAAIGTLCSLIGGSLGSRLAKKGAEKIVGKDELVIAQEKQAKELAQAAQTDSTVLNQVAGAAAERLQAEGADTDDAKIAFQSLNNISSRRPQAQTQTTTTNPFLTQTAAGRFNPQGDMMAQSIGFSY